MTRRRRYRFGLWAECLCRLSLRLRGYRILAARCRTPQGEIDIVAATAQVVAVIEVKARRDAASAAQALGGRRQQRLTAPRKPCWHAGRNARTCRCVLIRCWSHPGAGHSISKMPGRNNQTIAVR